MSTRRRVGIGTLGLLLSVAIVAGSGIETVNAAEKQWKMHAVWVPARPEITWMQEYFVDRVNQRLEGELEITLHPGASLGVKDVDMLRIRPPGNVIEMAAL